MSNSRFEIVDRRKEKKENLAPPAILEKTQDHTAEKSSWEQVKYGVAWRPVNQNQPGPLQLIILGRAAGLRSDGLAFIADYWFSPDYDDNRDWEAQTKKRLDTFLGCDCNDYAPCGVHKMYFQQWQEADAQRLMLAGNKPVPKVLEILHKAEIARMERARSIAVPRG